MQEQQLMQQVYATALALCNSCTVYATAELSIAVAPVTSLLRYKKSTLNVLIYLISRIFETIAISP